MKLLEYKDPLAITFSKNMYEKWFENPNRDVRCICCGAVIETEGEELCPDCDIFTTAQSGENIYGFLFSYIHHKNEAFYSNGKI